MNLRLWSTRGGSGKIYGCVVVRQLDAYVGIAGEPIAGSNELPAYPLAIIAATENMPSVDAAAAALEESLQWQ